VRLDFSNSRPVESLKWECSSKSEKSLIVLLLLYIAFFSFLFSTIPELPDRIATHFDGSGEANGWMSQHEYVRFAFRFGVGFPLLPVALSFCSVFRR
jgi:uncharacterized membrane protein